MGYSAGNIHVRFREGGEVECGDAPNGWVTSVLYEVNFHEPHEKEVRYLRNSKAKVEADIIELRIYTEVVCRVLAVQDIR